MSDIKLAGARIPAYAANGRRCGMYALDSIKVLMECGRIASTAKRKDGAIRRIYLKASKGEIAPASHRTATVVQVLPMTWSHNMRACAAYGSPSSM